MILSITACNTGEAVEADQSEDEMPSAVEATETQILTDLPPTETPLPPTETPLPTLTSVPVMVPGESVHGVDVGNRRRLYLLYIPPGLTDEQAVPVVFAFHGLTRDPSQMQRTSGFNETADNNGFVVVYPGAVEGSWSYREDDPDFIDESAFIELILLELNKIISVDPNRIYATGKSQGGVLAYRLACDMSDTFAAIASVAGPMAYSACEPTRAVSVLHIHGLDDYLIPFEGGGRHQAPPVQEGIDNWVGFNNCTESIVENDYDNGFTDTTYSSCLDGTTVELYTVEGMDHIWPDFASETIWEFFTAHPMP
jgi:polyhydroxybutyrate depolymerase